MKNEEGKLVDTKGRLVNKRGYLINEHEDVITASGLVIFRANELDADDEIPAPFVFEKHKAEFLWKALEEKNEQVDPTRIIEDDEDLIDQELMEIRPLSNHSSVDTLMGETPGMNNFLNEQHPLKMTITEN